MNFIFQININFIKNILHSDVAFSGGVEQFLFFPVHSLEEKLLTPFSPHSRRLSSHRQGVVLDGEGFFSRKFEHFFLSSPHSVVVSLLTPFCRRSRNFSCHQQQQRFLEWFVWRRKIAEDVERRR